MPTDKVRVLRIVEYVGPRDLVEEQVARSIHGTRIVRSSRKGELHIRAATLGAYPEVLDAAVEKTVEEIGFGDFEVAD